MKQKKELIIKKKKNLLNKVVVEAMIYIWCHTALQYEAKNVIKRTNGNDDFPYILFYRHTPL